MNVKTHGKIAILAAPILLALLFGCVDPLDMTVGGLAGGADPYVPPPAGKRHLVINAGEIISRTITPATPAVASYAAIAIGSSGTNVVLQDFGGSAVGTMTLDATDNYQIIVNAFNTSALVASAATTLASNIPSITLTLQANASTSGTFDYDFSNAVGTILADSVSLVYSSVLGGGGTLPSPASTVITSSLSSTQTLDSGVYRVSVIMEKDKYATTYNEQYVYIRDNLTSVWHPSQFAHPGRNVFEVTYNLNPGGGNASWVATVPTAQIIEVGIGETLTRPNPKPTNDNGTIFEDWYTAANATTGRLWVFPSDPNQTPSTSYQNRVIKDITLFAHWVSSTYSPEITIDPMDLAVPEPGMTVAVASFNLAWIYDNFPAPGDTSNDEVSFTINGGDTNYTNLKWSYNGYEITGSEVGVTLSSPNSGTLTLDMVGIYNGGNTHPLKNLLTETTHTILFTGNNPTALGGQPFSVYVQFVTFETP